MSEITSEITNESLRAARGGDPVVVATLVALPLRSAAAKGSKLLVRTDRSRLGALGDPKLDDAVATDCIAVLNEFPRRVVQALFYETEDNHVRRLEVKGGVEAFEIMLEIVEAPVTLLIVGGGHIGLSLATIGAHVGFSVAVLDDREMYANQERFPMADYVMSGDFTDLLRDFPIGPNTFAVLVSRGHKQDETALRSLVTSGARYVGMIGSKRRVSTVLRHLAEEGFPMDALERVYTPIGFDIGAETPEEIAVSIMAELIAVRRGGTGEPMRNDRPPIVPHKQAGS